VLIKKKREKTALDFEKKPRIRVQVGPHEEGEKEDNLVALFHRKGGKGVID